MLTLLLDKVRKEERRERRERVYQRGAGCGLDALKYSNNVL